MADFLIINKRPFLFYDGNKGGVVPLEHSPFSNVVPVARVQVPMTAVEFVVGYRDLVLSLVGLTPYTTELLYPEIVCKQHSAS